MLTSRDLQDDQLIIHMYPIRSPRCPLMYIYITCKEAKAKGCFLMLKYIKICGRFSLKTFLLLVCSLCTFKKLCFAAYLHFSMGDRRIKFKLKHNGNSMRKHCLLHISKWSHEPICLRTP